MNVNTNIRPNYIISQLAPMDQQGEVGGVNGGQEQGAQAPANIVNPPAMGQPNQLLEEVWQNTNNLRMLINNNLINGGQAVPEIDQNMNNNSVNNFETAVIALIQNNQLNEDQLGNNQLGNIYNQAADCGLYRILGQAGFGKDACGHIARLDVPAYRGQFNQKQPTILATAQHFQNNQAVILFNRACQNRYQWEAQRQIFHNIQRTRGLSIFVENILNHIHP